MPRVYALKDNVKKHIFHPSGRIKFNEAGEADWPLDQFTQRRIKDGDVSLTAPPRAVSSPVHAPRRTEAKTS
jgi:hypothetical protein